MKTKVSPALLGGFVLGAIVLAFVALLSFGGMHFFSKPQRFIVFFDESIHGLDLGSPVKLRGVRVGRVVDFQIRYDSAGHGSEVAVVCELSRNMIADTEGSMVNVSDRAVLQGMVDRGLRAQLNVQGLATGMLYVELNFYKAQDYPMISRVHDPKLTLIPAVPSAISEYQASLSEILSGLRKVDFAGISRDARALLADARQQINKVEVKELIAEWTRAAQSVRDLSTSPEIKKVIAGFETATRDLSRVLVRLDSRVEPTGQKIDDTLLETKKAVESFNATAQSLRLFLQANQGISENTQATLQRIGDAADSVQRLADFIERNPGALLSGRKKPE